ncbi:TonB-dependent receptor domain-containing protein [Methylocystis echinoides]|uniref:TonB-dependent receptor n=1 Tax=Methylocystis echinoides TaxID=29468 RepID=UPI00341CFCDF
MSYAAAAQQSLPTIEVRTAKRHTDAKTPPARRPAALRQPLVAALPPTPSAPRDSLPIVADRFGSTLVVPREELRRLPGATLGDLLFDKPGVTGSGYAPGAASRPIVRGLDNYRVRIQENGVAASGVSELGEDHAAPLDPLGANRVEVIHGPATLRWGAAAMGGVVNVENNRIPDHPPCADAALFRQSGCAAVETRAAASTVDGALENATLLDAGRGAFLLHADVAGRRAGDYAIPAYPYLFPPDPPPPVYGRQPNSAMRMGSASLGGTYLFDAGYVGFSVTQFFTRYHIPGIEPTATNTRIDMRQTRVASKGELRPRSAYVDTIRFWMGLGDYRHNELANVDGVDGAQQTFTNQELETRVETLLQPLALPFGTLKTSFGFQGAHQFLRAPGVEGGLFDPNRTKSVAGYLFNALAFNAAQRLEIAGRVEHAQISGAMPDFSVDPGFSTPRDRQFTPVSGAFGFLQDLPGDMVASLSAQYVQRAPRAPELFSRGAHEATGTFDVGDPNLKIEAAKTVEISLRRAPGPLRFEANLFYTRFDNFIFRNLTGESCEATVASCTPLGEGGDLAQAFYAQRNAVFRGGEFQGQLDVATLAGGTVSVESQFDVVRASFTGGGNVPRIPPVRLGGGLVWRDANWLARVNLLHAFAQNAIAETGETPTKGYNLLKAELSYRMVFGPNDPLGREMTFGLAGNNLLNADMRNSVSFRKNEVLLPGANLRLFANILF